MTPNRPQRPPYIVPRLDRWKIAGAVLLFATLVGLRLFGGIPTAAVPPEPALTSTPRLAPTAPVLAATPGATLAPTIAATSASDATPPPRVPFTAILLGSEKASAAALENSRPVLVGRSTPGHRVQIRLNNAIFTVTADATGSWYFAAPQPLPVGMTWVLARPLVDESAAVSPAAGAVPESTESASTETEDETLSLMAIIAPDAEPLEPPRFDPISVQPDASAEATGEPPVFSGSGPAGKLLQIARERSGHLDLLAQVRVRADGRWSWTPAEPLAAGRHRLVATALDPDGTRLTRSRPFLLDVGAGGAVASPPQIEPLPTLIPDFANGNRPHLFVLAGTAAPNARLFLYIDGEWVAGLRAGPDGVWRYALSPPVTLTTRHIQVIQVDETGRPLAASPPAVVNGLSTSAPPEQR